jgi:uncharacterized membrane protein
LGRRRKQSRALKRAQREGQLTAPSAALAASSGEREATVEQQQLRAEFYSGLLPHPEHLARFDEIAPGTAARIVGWVEQQATHRQRMESRFLNFNGVSQVLGTLFGGTALLGAIGGGIYLVAIGKDIQGFGTMVGALVAAIVVFATQRSGQRQEVDEKSYGRERQVRGVASANHTRTSGRTRGS